MTQAICELQKGIVDQGVSDHTLSSKEGPHITFCGIEAESREGVIRSLEKILESKWGNDFEASIVNFGVFSYNKKVVLAQPVITERWIQLHKKIVACCLEAGESPEVYHLPGKWVPHITLASRLNTDEIVKTAGWLAENFLPLSGSLD